jgi:hypothetical protein
MTSDTTTEPRPSPLADPIRRIARAFAGVSRPLAGRRGFTLWAVLVHQGRTSGRTYRTPIAARPTAGGFVIPMPFGAGTQWAKNLIAAGGGTLRWNGADHLIAEPEIIDATEAEAAFSRWQRAGVRAFGMRTFMRVRRVDQPSGDTGSRPASRTNR